MAAYFLLTAANEGVHVVEMDKFQLEKMLNEELAEGTERNFLPRYSGEELDVDRCDAVIIKGEVITPRTKEKIVEIEIP